MGGPNNGDTVGPRRRQEDREIRVGRRPRMDVTRSRTRCATSRRTGTPSAAGSARADIPLRHDGDLEVPLPRRVATRPGDRQQPVDQAAALRLGRSAARDDEDVEVAVSSQPGRDGRSEQVRAHGRITEDGANEADDVVELSALRRRGADPSKECASAVRAGRVRVRDQTAPGGPGRPAARNGRCPGLSVSEKWKHAIAAQAPIASFVMSSWLTSPSRVKKVASSPSN